MSFLRSIDPSIDPLLAGMGLGIGIAWIQEGQYVSGGITLSVAFLLFLTTDTGKLLKEKVLKLVRRTV